MTYRTTDQPGRMPVHVEAARPNELPAGVPAPSAPVQPGRDRGGRYVAGDPATREAARQAGLARRNRTALAHSLGVAPSDPDLAAKLAPADAFRRMQVRLLAQSVGGGTCGPAPAALVAQAALAMAASRLCYERGDVAQGARLGAEVRQCLLAAHELCAREAKGRPAPVPSWFQPQRVAVEPDDEDDDDIDDEEPDAADGDVGAAMANPEEPSE